MPVSEILIKPRAKSDAADILVKLFNLCEFTSA